ncbi:hypothetical protein EG328_004444 [Venturia inaequalis]|uniref:N-acetyltransferase domain-containing protein n=1 Tax=Venturia inaequalis TaxID=5025 RepID=A0A8H3YM14_VENIN|nr:hypothetical protein EG327_000827 [Venturia inaequalis]KAE9973382.1 hypothetical protein EG328_004444 [Venturia inaequalis]
MKASQKSVAFVLEPQIRIVAPAPRRRGITSNMEKTVYEAFHTDEGITEELLQEAARLFSENYGVWDKQAPHKVGKFAKEGAPVRLSKSKLRNEYLPSGISSYARVFVDGNLAVVHRDYRERGLARGLLDQINRDGSDIYGVMSSHPAACLAAARAFGNSMDHVSLDFMKAHAESMMKVSPVEYIRDAKLAGSLFDSKDTTGRICCVNSGFFVDHSEPLEALAWSDDPALCCWQESIEGSDEMMYKRLRLSPLCGQDSFVPSPLSHFFLPTQLTFTHNSIKMAAVAVTAVRPIPGVHLPLTRDHLNKSNTTYNAIPRISSDMHINQDHVKILLGIFVKHGVREKIGIHRLHKHDDILEKQVKLETKLKTKPGKWIKPVSIDSLNLNAIHPVVFKFVSVFSAGELFLRLDPYEFAEGPSPVSIYDVDNSSCMEEVGEYITKNNLADVIALKFLDPDEDSRQLKESTAEIEVGKYGTIVLPTSMMIGGKLIPTGWPDSKQPYDPEGDAPPGEHWNEAKSSTGAITHKVHVDSIENERELLDELVRQGIITA